MLGKVFFVILLLIIICISVYFFWKGMNNDIKDLNEENKIQCKLEYIENKVEIIGMDIERAKKTVHNPIRAVIIDGESQMVTMDYRPNRLNVETNDGKIIKIINCG